jgi:hypothetical protein
MRALAMSLLVGGFLWIVIDAGFMYSAEQHALWIWHTQHLADAENIPRTAASSALRDLGLELLGRHRRIVVPATIMFAGGVLGVLSPKASHVDRRQAQPSAASNRR